MRGSGRKFGVRSAHFTIISCVISMRSCCVFDSLRLLHFPLLAVYLLSYRPVFPPGHQLHPRGGGQIPCALLLMRTLAPLPCQESTGENGSLNDLEYDDVTIGIALSSPLFIQEREDDASHRRAYHSHDEGLSSSQSTSVGQTSEKIRATAQKVSKSGFFWNDKESRFSLTIKQRFENTSSRPIMTEEVFKS